jgi:hypothetical protein
VGELDTQRVEFRHASSLGRDWYLKAIGGYHRSSDFTRSRVETMVDPVLQKWKALRREFGQQQGR